MSLLFRFLTCADDVGVEKVAAAEISDAYLEAPYVECRALDNHSLSAREDVFFFWFLFCFRSLMNRNFLCTEDMLNRTF